MKKFIALLVVLAAVLGLGAYWYMHSRSGPQTVFHFDEVKRGRIVATVGSTGSVQARELVAAAGLNIADSMIHAGGNAILEILDDQIIGRVERLALPFIS